MTIVTDNTMRLTPEQAGVMRYALESHLLGQRLGEGALMDELGLGSEPNWLAIERLARRLQLCADIATDLEHGLLLIDQEGLLDLLSACEVEEEESGDGYRDEGDNEADTMAIIRGRAATLRLIRDLVERRLQLAGGGV